MFCSAGHVLHENMQLGNTILEVTNASTTEMERMKKEGMKSLIMHEIGHTLGLNHNTKASQVYSPDQLSNADFIKEKH